jgi:hypothetical protein
MIARRKSDCDQTLRARIFASEPQATRDPNEKPASVYGKSG